MNTTSVSRHFGAFDPVESLQLFSVGSVNKKQLHTVKLCS